MQVHCLLRGSDASALPGLSPFRGGAGYSQRQHLEDRCSPSFDQIGHHLFGPGAYIVLGATHSSCM